MATRLSPGVYMEERASEVQITSPVTASTTAFIGWTPKGPDNEPTLVTSFQEFTEIFGSIVPESYMGHNVAAFFANDGRRAYIVRIPPSDAVVADSYVSSSIYEQETNTGSGAGTVISNALLTPNPLLVNSGTTPVVPDTVSFRWRGAGTAVTAQQAKQRDGVTNLQTVPGSIFYEGMVDPALVEDESDKFHRIVPGTVTLNFTDNVGAATVALPGTTDIVTVTGGGRTITFDHRSGRFSLIINGAPASATNVTVDYTPAWGDRGNRATATVVGIGGPNGQVFVYVDDVGVTGNNYTVELIDPGAASALSAVLVDTYKIEVTLAHDGTNITSTATLVASAISGLAGVTAVAQGTGAGVFTAGEGPTAFSGGRDVLAGYFEATDDGAGVLSAPYGLTGPGTINYTTGAYSMTSVGGLTVTTGATSAGFTTNTYSGIPHNQSPVLCDYAIKAWALDADSPGIWGNDIVMTIQGDDDYYNILTGSYSRYLVDIALDGVTEVALSGVTFTDSSSSSYFPDFVNARTGLLLINEPGADLPPGELNGVARSMVLAGGDENSGTRQLDVTLLKAPVVPGSVVITYKNTSGVTRTVTDNRSGDLIGDVDSVGDNTINYTTGVIDLLLEESIDGASFVTAVYASDPATETDTTLFGQTSLGHTAGTDGTFTSTTYGRNQFTAPALSVSETGMFALNRVDDLLQVVIPDFIGDEIITQDSFDYAESRVSQPAGADRFILQQPPRGMTSRQAVDYSRFTLNRKSVHGALYWPWINVTEQGELGQTRSLTVPAVGHVAGIYARTDNFRNIGKAPGGTRDGVLRYSNGLESAVTQADADRVYPERINPLVDTIRTGRVVWGVRTHYPVGEVDFRFVNNRRTFNFIMRSIYDSTHWIVFENNGPALWARIATQIRSFLSSLFSQGILAGVNPAQAFSVIVDSTNNTSTTIEAGEVIIDVGVALFRPAEFVVFRVRQNRI